jgi:hypothetical protein
VSIISLVIENIHLNEFISTIYPNIFFFPGLAYISDSIFLTTAHFNTKFFLSQVATGESTAKSEKSFC